MKEMEMKEKMFDYLQSNSLGVGFQELCDFVINKNNCVYCGACVSLCPRIGINEEKPNLLEYDPECSMCVSYCARTFFPEDEFKNDLFSGQAHKYDFLLGDYQKIAAAKSNDDDVVKLAQNGGVVSSLLIHALNTDLVDGILLTDKDEDWYPKPVIARTPDEVLDYAGSKYTIAPTLITYKDAVKKYKLKRLAFVGLPCQIQSARKLQAYPPLSEEFGKIKLIIGLYCLSNYSYESLKEMVKQKFGISMRDVRKFDIHRGKFIVQTKKGVSKEIPIKDTKEYKWPSCQFCKDSTAEFADISVGSVGAPKNDWNTVIIRSDVGLNLFNDAVASKHLITADTVDISRIKKVSFGKKSQISKIENSVLNGMQLLGGSDLEVRTYTSLISLGHATLAVLNKVLKVDEKDILNALNTLKKREWITSTDGIISPVNPNQVIRCEIDKLKKDLEQKINTIESEVLMDLKCMFVQNNFKDIRYKEFMDLI